MVFLLSMTLLVSVFLCHASLEGYGPQQNMLGPNSNGMDSSAMSSSSIVYSVTPTDSSGLTASPMLSNTSALHSATPSPTDLSGLTSPMLSDTSTLHSATPSPTESSGLTSPVSSGSSTVYPLTSGSGPNVSMNTILSSRSSSLSSGSISVLPTSSLSSEKPPTEDPSTNNILSISIGIAGGAAFACSLMLCGTTCIIVLLQKGRKGKTLDVSTSSTVANRYTDEKTSGNDKGSVENGHKTEPVSGISLIPIKNHIPSENNYTLVGKAEVSKEPPKLLFVPKKSSSSSKLVDSSNTTKPAIEFSVNDIVMKKLTAPPKTSTSEMTECGISTDKPHNTQPSEKIPMMPPAVQSKSQAIPLAVPVILSAPKSSKTQFSEQIHMPMGKIPMLPPVAPSQSLASDGGKGGTSTDKPSTTQASQPVSPSASKRVKCNISTDKPSQIQPSGKIPMFPPVVNPKKSTSEEIKNEPSEKITPVLLNPQKSGSEEAKNGISTNKPLKIQPSGKIPLLPPVVKSASEEAKHEISTDKPLKTKTLASEGVKQGNLRRKPQETQGMLPIVGKPTKKPKSQKKLPLLPKFKPKQQTAIAPDTVEVEQTYAAPAVTSGTAYSDTKTGGHHYHVLEMPAKEEDHDYHTLENPNLVSTRSKTHFINEPVYDQPHAPASQSTQDHDYHVLESPVKKKGRLQETSHLYHVPESPVKKKGHTQETSHLYHVLESPVKKKGRSQETIHLYHVLESPVKKKGRSQETIHLYHVLESPVKKKGLSKDFETESSSHLYHVLEKPVDERCTQVETDNLYHVLENPAQDKKKAHAQPVETGHLYHVLENKAQNEAEYDAESLFSSIFDAYKV